MQVIKKSRPQQAKKQPQDSSYSIYCKRNCQLRQFPVIRLHVLQNIEELDLSNNLITDLRPLTIHLQTSKHVLSKLKKVNLSGNKIPDVLSLAPLAEAAIVLEQISIKENPLVLTLNFLYELIIIFKQITKIQYSNTLIIQESTRMKAVQFQLRGSMINDFLRSLKVTIEQQPEEIIEEVQNIIQTLGTFPQSIIQHNSLLFQSMKIFLELVRQNSSPDFNGLLRSQIYDEPQYQVMTTPQLSSKHARQCYQTDSLIGFYYDQIMNASTIQSKLVEDLQVEQGCIRQLETGKISLDPAFLLPTLQAKWQKQLELTKTYFFSQFDSNQYSSPFKSIQTEDCTERKMVESRAFPQSYSYYFGLDNEWTEQTHRFIQHRLLSYLKQLLQVTPKQIIGKKATIENTEQLQSMKKNQIDKRQKQDLAYHSPIKVFSGWALNGQSRLGQAPQIEFEALSPKSKNKFILASCLKILENVVKKIVFRKIVRSNLIKYEYLTALEGVVIDISARFKTLAFRKLFENSMHFGYITQKLQSLKKFRIFKAWSKIRRRKMKLIKSLIKRKIQKETAFLSVALTQWRLTSRYLTTYQKCKDKVKLFTLTEDSTIIKPQRALQRSVTCRLLRNTKIIGRSGI